MPKKEFFYENGQMRTIQSFENGVLHGEVILYWPNGQIKRKCYFVHGKRKGLDQMWDSRGQLIDSVDYV